MKEKGDATSDISVFGGEGLTRIWGFAGFVI